MNKLFTFASVMLLVGCAGGSHKPTVPDIEDARKACPVTEGTVIQVTGVTIENNPEIAQASGATLGGYAANRALKGAGEVAQVLGTAAGAVVGSVAGDAAGKAALNKDGQELLVVIGSQAHSIIQETDSRQPFAVGDNVWVIGDLNDNYRYNRRGNTNCQNGIRAIRKQ